MASSPAQKKKEETSLKLLRELISLPNNKQCFECQQKGPTYVDMTTCAFICTQCSGFLRGINPPHRVKSVSMTTFNNDEIQKLKSGGNEV
jgi:Arf-GAP domain and FG repeat-containing protein 1